MSDGVYITLGADATELETALAKADAALLDLSEHVHGTSGALDGMEGSSKGVIEQWDKASGVLRRGGEAFQEISEDLEAGRISAEQASRGLEGIAAAARKAMGASESLSLATAGARRELIVMGHEALTGNWTRFGPSLMVLAERMGGVKLSTMGMAGAVGVAGYTLFEMIASAEQAERVTNKLETAFAAVGNAGMMSRAGIEEAVTQIARLPGINREAADQIIADFARTRQIGATLFQELTADIDQSARAMGVDAPAAAKKLAGAFADPAKGARQLDAEYDILTAAQLQQIETMGREGDRIGAQNVLLAAWKERLAELPPGLTKIQTASNALANAWDHLTGAIGRTEGWQTARQAVANFFDNLAAAMGGDEIKSTAAKIADVQEDIAATQRRLAVETGWMNAGARRGDEASLADSQRQLAALQARKAEEDRLAAATRARVGAQQEASGQNLTQQRKADLTDPNLVPTMEKVRQIDEVIARLEKDKQGASAAEIRQLDQIIALKEKERDQALKPSGASGAPTQMGQWRAQLVEQQQAVAQQHSADATYHTQALQLDVTFWAQKAALAKAGSKEQLAASTAEAEAEKRLYEAEAEAARKAAADKKAAGKTVAAAQAEVDKQSLEAEKQRLDEEVAAGRMTLQQKVALLRQFTDAAYAETLCQLDADDAGLVSGTQAWAEALKRRAELVAQYQRDVAASDNSVAETNKAAAKKTEQAWTKAFEPATRSMDSMIQGVCQGTQTIDQVVRRSGYNMALSYTESFAKMTLQFAAFKASQALGWDQMAAAAKAQIQQGSMSWLVGDQAKTAATVQGNAQRTAADASGQSTFIGRVGEQLSRWLGLETSKTSETVTESGTRTTAEGTAAAAAVAGAKAQATGTIPPYAAQAAAAAMQSVAAIPLVGWAMAPAVGAETFTDAMAYLPMASAAGGIEQVPMDGMLFELHRDEQVLPASYATPLRSFVNSLPAMGLPSGFGAPSNSTSSAGSTPPSSSSGSGGGVTNIYNIAANDAASFVNMARRNNLGLVGAVNSAIGTGAAVRTVTGTSR